MKAVVEESALDSGIGKSSGRRQLGALDLRSCPGLDRDRVRTLHLALEEPLGIVDLVITNTTPYHTTKPWRNGHGGMAGGKLGTINLAGSSFVELQARMVRMGTYELVLLDRFYWVSLPQPLFSPIVELTQPLACSDLS